KKGVALSAVGLGTFLTTEAVSAVPAGLAASISTVAVTTVGAGASTTALLKVLTLANLKTGLVTGILLAGIVTPLVIYQHARTYLHGQNRSTRLQSDAASFVVSAPGGNSRAVQPSPYVHSDKSTAIGDALRRSLLRSEGAR